MDEYRVNGSTAYAPLPVKRPSRLPDEPKKKPQPAPKRRAGIAPFTVVGTAVALVLLFCVLFSYMRLFETQSEQKAMEERREALLSEQERLRAQYESEIDLDEVAERAAALGMHLPRAEQIQSVEVEVSESVEEAITRVKMNVFEAFQALWRDMQAYFS